MKVILSRKGFDSSAGGKPSPILGKQMLSIPIPEGWSGVSYENLIFHHEGKDFTYRKLLEDLNCRQFMECHLDPDIRPGLCNKREGIFSPAFGQSGAQATELKDIEEGDIFLFFGTFRQCHYDDKNGFAFEKKAQEIHAIWGYLEVGEIIQWDKKQGDDISAPIKSARELGLERHPHVQTEWIRKDNNRLFLPTRSSSFFPGQAGYGTFEYNAHCRLTAKSGATHLKSRWEPVDCLSPMGNRIRQVERYRRKFWDSGGRGQEYIFEVLDHQLLESWLSKFSPYSEL